MNPAVKAVQLTIRIAGGLQLILGVLIWTGRLEVMLFLHILIGVILVIGLWVLAWLANRAGVTPNWVGLLIFWGLVMILIGLTQAMLFTGSTHWIIQVVHLLVGLAGVGLAEMLVRRFGLTKGPAQTA